MNLTEVSDFLGLPFNGSSIELQNIQLDSRLVEKGDLFVAVPGLKTDGKAYVQQALDNGAAAVLVEAPYGDATAIAVPNLKQKLPELAAFFYNYPAHALKIIGITGTNGKTSCSHYIAQILETNNIRCGIMGTLGNGLLHHLSAASLTTGDCCSTQRQFAAFTAQNVGFVAMEVSSHALDQQRLATVNFDTAIFTNLSQDHLDYHADMQDYFLAKTKLFTEFAPKNAVINIDDPYGKKLLQIVSPNTKILTYSLTDSTADLYLDQNQIHTPWGNGTFNSPLIGKFNQANVLACIACCGIYGLSLEAILSKVAKLVAVPGRMQRVAAQHSNQPTVIVDYSHTPDAIIKALQTLRDYKPRTLYCIFGCGGDRDRGKRPLMFRAALEYSDQVVVTMDNPRTEDPQQIVDDILAGATINSNINIEFDRALAIKQTIARAAVDDIVLIAGKGHEDYQIIGTQKRPFSDLLIAQQALELRSEQPWTI